MARPTPQNINCPQCGQPFNAIIEQILDVGHDPAAKQRLLSGRVNVVSCPHCGFQGMVGTPLFYHDPEKELAIAYVPMELNLEKEQREKMIGDMTQAVMRAMPEEAPKGHLLQPNTALTMQGLIDQVLEADGITQEMINKERKKVEVIEQLGTASKAEADEILEENWDLVDRTFLELLSASAQAASQQNENRKSLRLLNIRSQLMEETEAGQELKKQEDALREASEELQALGDELTRESFVDLIVKAADRPEKVGAFATIGQGLLDYQTFQVLSERIEAEDDPDKKEQLTDVREHLLAAAAEYEKQSRAIVEQAVDTLRSILAAPDIRQGVMNHIDRIDQTFLQVLQANIEEARKSGNVEVSSRLQEIQDEVMDLVQQSAPPEIRLINDMLTVESTDEALEIMDQNTDLLSEDLLAVMEDLSMQLRQAGNEPVAQRLDMLREEVASRV